MVSATQAHLTESTSLREASFDSEGRTLHLTLIRAGFNTSRSRYYTVEALRSGVAAFSGAQQYLDHPTASETRERPEGSIRNWVASLGDVVYDEASQSLRGTAKIIDPDFLNRVKLMDEQGVLNTLGVSIRAIGAGEDAEVDGSKTFRVDEFIEGISADFVTRPGAGGYVEFRESDNTPNEENDMSAEAIAAAERRAVEAEQRANAAEERARVAEEAAKKAQESAVIAQSALESLQAESALRASQEAIGKLIDATNLPSKSTEYLRTLLAQESDVEKAKTEIDRFVQMFKEAAPSNPVRNMGESSASSNVPSNVDVNGRIASVFGGAR